MILITNLGKAQKRDKNRYRTANYKFEDGEVYTTQLFSSALLKWLGKKDEIDKLVILGTKTSMWDALLEFDFIEDGITEKDMTLASELYERINDNHLSGLENGVKTKDLEQLSQRLSELAHIDIICREIPLGLNDDEQHEILRIISEEVPKNSNLYFDFTHGLRHLPFFATLAIFYLKQAKNVDIKGIYYGALDLTDPDTGETPVISMKHALRNIDWVNALSVAEASGSYKKIAELAGNKKLAQDLELLSFLRNTNQIGEMKKITEEVQQELNEGHISKETELYKDKLFEHFLWSDKDHYALRQLEVARQALDNDNYTQATILALEAFISARVVGAPTDYNTRESAKEKLWKTRNATYHTLNAIRNSFAHGSRAKGSEAQRITSSPTIFKKTMLKYFDNIEESIHAKKGV